MIIFLFYFVNCFGIVCDSRLHFLKVYFCLFPVFGPRGHIDSGQTTPSTVPSPISTQGVFSESSPKSLESSEECEDYEDYDNFNYDDYEEEGEWYQDEDIYGTSDLTNGDENSESDDLNSEEYSEESDEESEKESGDYEEESETVGEPPTSVVLKRVRRRIIPVGGAAIDRSRGGRGENARSRSSWSEPHQYGRQRESVIRRRKGPTASAALFSLFPELAPPGYKKKKGNKSAANKAGKKAKSQHATTKTPAKDPFSKETNEKPQSDERSKGSFGGKKRHSKLSQELKEEIAAFAEAHGVDRAVLHFKSRVDVPLRERMVEKFLRRYRNRRERRARRS